MAGSARGVFHSVSVQTCYLYPAACRQGTLCDDKREGTLPEVVGVGGDWVETGAPLHAEAHFSIRGKQRWTSQLPTSLNLSGHQAPKIQQLLPKASCDAHMKASGSWEAPLGTGGCPGSPEELAEEKGSRLQE